MKENQMQIGGEGIENLLMNMIVKNNYYKYISPNTPFHVSLC
jgi:hypothetical protein